MSEASPREGLRLLAILVAADLQAGGSVLAESAESSADGPARRGRKPTTVRAFALHRLDPPGLGEATALAAPPQETAAVHAAGADAPVSARPAASQPVRQPRVASRRAELSAGSPPQLAPTTAANGLPVHPPTHGVARAA
jgi:hypothetical protein